MVKPPEENSLKLSN